MELSIRIGVDNVVVKCFRKPPMLEAESLDVAGEAFSIGCACTNWFDWVQRGTGFGVLKFGPIRGHSFLLRNRDQRFLSRLRRPWVPAPRG